MRRLLSFVFLFCFLILDSFFAFSDENLKLVFALDLVRHGDRAPKRYIPEISETWSKDEAGKITLLGKKQAQLLGEEFRNYYINKTQLLPKKFQSDLIQINSTKKQRTEETTKSILKGMFPNSSNKIEILEYKGNSESKKKLRLVMNKLLKNDSSSNKWFETDIKQQLKTINNIFGTKFSTTQEFISIADLIRVSKIYNKPLLKKLPNQVEQDIISLADRHKLKLRVYPEVACPYGENFVEHVADILQSEQKQKYILYVAHDTNIITVVSLLGFDLKNRLPYLADLRFEVFQDMNNGKRFVKTSLNGRVIKICKSSDNCPLKEFVKTLGDNIKNKCKSTST